MTHRLLTLLVGCVLVGGTTLSHAQPESIPDLTPPRLSLVDGDVSFWRLGAEEWTPARLNTPLTAGDELYTDSRANCELQVGPRAYVRAGGATALGISAIEPDFLQVSLTAGESAVDVRELLPGHTIEVDTPQAAFTVEHPGYYRIHVERELASFIARRGGAAIASAEGEQPMVVQANEELVLSGTRTAAPRARTYEKSSGPHHTSILY
ncbi:MAG: hypothetical protein HYZ72_17525 [Deltaproteobacteria bacterium]|nr:hypothetical protein [Deltaproteobacteria bacterium]